MNDAPDAMSGSDPSNPPAPKKPWFRPLAWAVLVLAPLFFLPSTDAECAAFPMILLGLWAMSGLYLVAVPRRLDDETDPGGRRTAVKVALWLFGLIAAYVAWNFAIDRIPATENEPNWFSRLVLLPGDLLVAINLHLALLGLAPVLAVFVLSQRRFLFPPDSIANRLLLLLGIPFLFLVCAGAWHLLVAMSCIV